MKLIKSYFSFSLIISLAIPCLAQDFGINSEDFEAPKQEYSPYADDNFPKKVYFGDTHLHTSISMDAGATTAR